MRPLPYHAGSLLSLLVGCTYDPPIRVSESYANPVMYSDESSAHPRREQYQAYLDRAVSEGLPGAVLLIRTPGEGTWVGTAGYADIANEVKWQPNTRGRIGSVTKTFAAAVILRLEEQSLLSLDAPASEHLPARISSSLANARSATIRQLVQHTSGIPEYLESSKLLLEVLGSYDYEYQNKERLLEYAYGLDAEFPAGAGWGYSSTNYLLLELVAEHAALQSSRTLLESLIFQPLGLRSTFYDPEHSPPPSMARGYGDVFADGHLIDVTDNEIERFHYDGGIVSTVYDLADFLDALLTGDALGDAARDALRAVVPTHGKSPRGTDFYGTGLILEDHADFGAVYGHSGTTLGFSAHMYHLEHYGITYAALVNASQHSLEERSYRWFSPLKHDDILRLVVGEP